MLSNNKSMLESEIKIIPIIESLKIFQLEDKEYFKIKAISNSKLKLINPLEDGSPEKYNEGIPSSSNASFVTGTAIHQMVLQKESYYINEEINKPTGKLNDLVDCIFKYRKRGYSILESINIASLKVDYYTNKLTKKRIDTVIEKCLEFYLYLKNYDFSKGKEPIFLDNVNRTKVITCVNNVNSNVNIINKLYPEDAITFNEYVITINFKVIFPDKTEIILPFKGKIDNFSILPESNEIFVNDLKSTGKYIADFGGSFVKFHYHRQIAIYSYLVKLLAEKSYGYDNLNNYKLYPTMVLVSTIPMHEVGNFIVKDLQVIDGINEFKNLFKRVAFHEVYGYDKEFLKI